MVFKFLGIETRFYRNQNTMKTNLNQELLSLTNNEIVTYRIQYIVRELRFTFLRISSYRLCLREMANHFCHSWVLFNLLLLCKQNVVMSVWTDCSIYTLFIEIWKKKVHMKRQSWRCLWTNFLIGKVVKQII